MRMFAAVRLSEEAIEDLEEFLEPRRDAFGLRWTPPEHWHVTLAFLAEVPRRAEDDLVDRMAEAVARRTSIELTVAGGGVYPDPFAASVFWAGVRTDDQDGVELERLAGGCRTAAARAGVGVDGARFRPHLTLGRRRPGDATRWLRLLEGYQGPSWVAGEVELITSQLGQGRNGSPQHHVIEQFPMGPRTLTRQTILQRPFE